MQKHESPKEIVELLLAQNVEIGMAVINMA